METAAVLVGGILLQVVAGFQVALAFGAPWGDHAYGGRAETVNGRLPPAYRVMSALAVPVLLFSSWIILAKADLVSGGGDWVNVAIWFVFGYLVLNTAANLASNSKIERYGMGALSAIAALGTLIVALG
jgi:hypothetical protein